VNPLPDFRRFSFTSHRCFWTVAGLTLVAGVFVQKLLPLFFPQGHLGSGLFVGDSAMVQEFSLKALEKLQAQGWAWEAFRGQDSLLVCLVASLYHLTGITEPWIFLPVQALSQAWIASRVFFWGRQAGFSAGVSGFGAIWLGLNPQSFEWSTQLGKDGFFLLGNILILSGLTASRWVRGILQILGGSLVVYFLRPGWGEILVMQGGLVFLGGLFVFAPEGKLRGLFLASSLALFGIILTNLFRLSPSQENTLLSTPRQYLAVIRVQENNPTSLNGIVWTKSGEGLGWLEGFGYRIFSLRKTYLIVGGRSLVDQFDYLNSIPAQIGYVPRALQISLLAPYPWGGPDRKKERNPLLPESTWKQDYAGQETIRKGRFIFQGMMGLAYLFFASLVVWMIGEGRPGLRAVLPALLFCLPVLILLAMVCPNLGTLVRVRFAFWGILTVFGAFAAGRAGSETAKNLRWFDTGGMPGRQ